MEIPLTALTGLKMYFIEQQGADLLSQAIALRTMEGEGATAEVLDNLLAISSRRQIYFGKAENSELLAYVAIAKISKYTLSHLAIDPLHRLRLYELTEGKLIYIMDGFFRRHQFRKALPIIKKILKRYRLICFRKSGRLKIYYRCGSKYKSVTSKIAHIHLAN
jgi:hypothetical protein